MEEGIKPTLKEKLFSVLIHILVSSLFIYLSYLGRGHGLPVGLIASTALLTVIIFFIYKNYQRFSKAQKITSVAYFFSFLVTALLFFYQHFVDHIDITVLELVFLLGGPGFLYNYLKKKEKQKSSLDY